MYKFITSKLNYKIMFWLFLLLSLSNLAIIFLVSNRVATSSIDSTKKNLNIVTEAMFQSLRNAMNTGMPEVIAKAEEDARKIKGVNNLTVAKSKSLIELYSPQESFTTDPLLVKSFEDKEVKVLEYDDDNGHRLRLIKPMIATQECLMCHANQEVGQVIGTMDLTFSLTESDNDLSTILLNIFIAATILGWITLIVVYFVIKKTTKPLGSLKDAIEALMKYSSANQDIMIKSHDEIGEVAKYFNEYQRKIRTTMAEDQRVVEAVEKSVQMVRSGFFNYTIKETSNNRATNDLKNAVNEMIVDLNEKFNQINNALIQYGNAKFNYDFKVDGASDSLGSIVMGTKALGNNVSELLAMIMISGEDLSKNISVLSDASNSLSKSSNEQAASLEETASAIEEIASTIKSSGANVIKMAGLSDEVAKSAIEGQTLANETEKSMNNINDKISLVNESITVIDQIAFQTNILSLNAAVEAATAGEAGKGFAVVAGEVRNLASRSADAAREIKDLVESATNTANAGKITANKMIDGYKILSEKISQNKEMIDNVSIASKEQERGIAQINNSISIIDKMTQENASQANNINELANEVQMLSDKLINMASHAEYNVEAKNHVCDIDLSYKLNTLKLEHINFKQDSFTHLNEAKAFKVKSCNECNLGIWMSNCESKNLNFTKTQNWKNLQENHKHVHESIQEYIEKNAQQAANERLIEIATRIEKHTENLFNELNIVKKENCLNS